AGPGRQVRIETLPGTVAHTLARPAATVSEAREATVPQARAEQEREPTGPRPLLVVVGTAEPSAAEQIRRLADDGATVLRLPLEALCADDSAAPTAPPPLRDDAVTVFTPAPGPAPADLSPRRLVHGLARTVAAALARHDGPVDLVLTGGETARRVLDALGVTELHPVGQVHHGAVHLRTPDGRSVVTRPGSFGDADSLRQIVHALRPHPTQRKVRP
ncbi:MAG: hypothetical protein HOY75_39850, partial [Streptomyces sp.]|nr:hypothetical protein [Streptomyces sp.]